MQYLKTRIGFVMNNENHCFSNDNLLGFGNEINMHPWGPWPVAGGGCAGAQTGPILSAYGWIFVR